MVSSQSKRKNKLDKKDILSIASITSAVASVAMGGLSDMVPACPDNGGNCDFGTTLFVLSGLVISQLILSVVSVVLSFFGMGRKKNHKICWLSFVGLALGISANIYFFIPKY